MMKPLIFFLSMFVSLSVWGQARQANVIVVPFVEPGETESEQIKDAILHDDAVTLALAKIKEEFSLRGFGTVDFLEEFRRTQNRDFAASSLNAKNTGLQSYVDNARADIYVTVKITKDDMNDGTSHATVILEAKERETAFSLANASVVSPRARNASKKELTELALEEISENFFNQLKLAFRNMVENGREVNVAVNVDDNCEFDMEADEVGTDGLMLLEEVDEWVLQNAFKGNGEVRGAGNGLNIFMRVPVYDPETGKPVSITRSTGKLRSFINKLVSPLGYQCANKASSGQYIQLLIQLKPER